MNGKYDKQQSLLLPLGNIPNILFLLGAVNATFGVDAGTTIHAGLGALFVAGVVKACACLHALVTIGAGEVPNATGSGLAVGVGA